jgi:metallo-beta-lactamase family protein
VFSGDLGNPRSPLLRDAEIIKHADILLLESTYGDRDHKPLENTLDEFKDIFAEAARTGGNVLIPAFSVGRSQDLIYWLGKLQKQGGLPQQHIFLDSPMAISASKIYAEYSHLFNSDDKEFNEVAAKGWRNWLQGLIYSETAEDSMAINRITGGAIIIAGSGMCTGGRIRHHLKYNLWKRNAHVVIAGYQAQGTLGRLLVEGRHKYIKILGSEIKVEATIHTLGALSAHADQTQLLQWAAHFEAPKPRLFLVHGEKTAAMSLQTCFNRSHWQSQIAREGECITF